MLVDSGAFFADDRATHGMLRIDAVIKNNWVLQAYDRFPVDVANLSSFDLAQIARLTRTAEFEKNAIEHPILKRLISANLTAGTSGFVLPKPFIIREVSERRSQGTAKPIKVGFIGVAGAIASPSNHLTLSDPLVAAKRVLPEIRRRSDVVIMLAHVKLEDALQLARQVPGIDVLIVGTGELFTPPIRIGQTLIVFTPYETRILGELRFYRGDQANITVKERFVSLDDQVPDDPEALEYATKQRNDYKSETTKFISLLARRAPENAGVPTKVEAIRYASAQSCSPCHSAQYLSWVNTKHARASDPLAHKATEVDAGCLSCHTTGFEKGGFRDVVATPTMLNVQCEQCHGPALEHVKSPKKGYGRIADMRALCSSCHTTEIQPGFDLKAAWATIKH